MREIKFRVWDKENNKFWEDFNEAYNNKIEQLLISPGGDICIRKMDGMYHESTFPGRFVLQQYTGIKDCNGVKVYEGDIFIAPHDFGPGGFDERRAVVRFHEEHGYQWHYWLIDQLEVIGNIYQNPEQLNS